MGQSGSAQLEQSPAPVLTKPLPVKKVPPPRPSSPPKRPRSPPKNPKYKVPENRVLPLGDLPQRKLRPISQEISKVFPEYAVFHTHDDEDELEKSTEEEAMDTTEEGSKLGTNYEKSSETVEKPAEKIDFRQGDGDDFKGPDRQTNGVIPNGNVVSYNTSVSTDENMHIGPDESNLRRTHSLDRAQARPKGHRRQSSRTTSLMNEEHTIFEDPRESLAENRDHLYDNWRKDPHANGPSNIVSLPVRTHFDIELNYNMTYAQLAEHRRQKNLEELEKKTGISVERLQSDLTENSNLPFNPFQRQASRESTRSTSTASSDAGVSKRKKKRAPPPPGSKVDNYVEDEPPVDYDLEDPSVPETKMHQRRMSTTSAVSNMSTKSKPAPLPPTAPSSQISSKGSTTASSTTTDSAKSSSSSSVETVSPARSIPSSSSSISSSLGPSQSIPPPPRPPSLESSVNTSKEKQAISKLDRLLSKENADNRPSDDELEKEENKSVKPSLVKSPEKRLNSLVGSQSESDEDHDKVRVLKGKIPPLVLEKPKDESQIFREKLAQAYEERTKRREEEIKRKEEQERKLKEKLAEEAKKKEEEEEEGNMSARSEKKHGESVEILRRLSRDLDKKWLSTHRSQSPEAMSSHETDDELSSKDTKSPGHRRVFSEDWTPEHDLDSDDDIEDRNAIFSHQRSTSEGFKSSIVPTKVNELKKSTKSKYIRKQSDSSNDDKQKYGSIRKLKKTVHKSVKNAFGSISRASGKLLRKQRSIDFDNDDAAPPPPPPSNWHLSASTHQLNGDTQQIERRLSQGNILTSEEEDSESESEEVLAQPGPVSSYSERLRPEINGHILDTTSSLQNGTRDLEKADETSRLYKKKKKKNGFVTNGKQSENDPMESLMTEKIKEKQRQIGLEKQRQLDIEREMLRLQALEQEERYQRLQTAHFQQQLQILQQSVPPGHSTVSAPPLPPAGGLHSYSVPDFTSQSHHGYPHMMNQGLPQAAMPSGVPFSNGSSSHNLGNLTSYDINYLSNLMRMNGVQPPGSPQQWAYLLNSVSLPTQPGQSKSMYPGPELPTTAHQVKSMYVTTSGPDLTKMFPGHSLDDSQIRTSKKSMMDYLTARKQSQSFSNLTDHHMDPPQMNNLLHEYERSAVMHGPPVTEKAKQRSNPVYYSSDEEDLSSGLSPARTSRNYVASVHVKDYRTIPNLQHGSADTFMSGGDVRSPTYAAYHVQTSPSHRQRSPGEDSSSSGADR